jgi:EmrB/QacA subfamily drug resistance transporter
MKTQTLQVSVNQVIPNKVILVTFLLAIFMGALDNGIVGPALSSIQTHFGVTASWGVWSFTIYTLLFAVSIPIMGKLSDRYGRKFIFTNGITLFAVGSLLAAVAPNFTLFLLGRAIQAIGTGGIFPITAAQITATYPAEVRGKYLGYIGVVFGFGSILGPVAGGLMIGFLQWQWIFLINLPITMIILVLLTKVNIEQTVSKRPIDFKGILLLAATILMVMLGFTLENLSFIGAGVLTTVLLIGVEKKAVDPVMNLEYFTKRNPLFILLLSLVSGFVMATALNLLPLYSESVVGLAKGESGLGVTPLAISSMIASLVGGFLVDKIGAKKVLVLGFIIALLGAGSLALFVTTLPTLIGTITILGFGVGIIIGAPLNVMIIQNLSMNEAGSAVGFLSLFRSIGSTLGPTIAGIILTVYQNDFTLIYLISAGLSVIAIVMILTMKRIA